MLGLSMERVELGLQTLSFRELQTERPYNRRRSGARGEAHWCQCVFFAILRTHEPKSTFVTQYKLHRTKEVDVQYSCVIISCTSSRQRTNSAQPDTTPEHRSAPAVVLGRSRGRDRHNAGATLPGALPARHLVRHRTWSGPRLLPAGWKRDRRRRHGWRRRREHDARRD
jgi:hypothetical protein